MVSLAGARRRFTYRGGVKLAAAAVSAVVLSALAGCGGSSAPAAGPSPRPVPTPTCPSATTTPGPTSTALSNALSKVPFGLPMPDNITVLDATTTKDGIQVVKFTTPTSLRQVVLFIVDRYPKAGYTLGRGDAEATEADAPFVKDKVHGLTRVAALESCKTLWLVATAATTSRPGGTSPLLSPHPTSSQTSALPFG
jgi:hypothetical protein